MKRCAILLAGLWREHQNMDNIIKYIIKPNSEYIFDIFIAVWDEVLDEIGKEKLYNFDETILNIYSPTKYIIMNYKLFVKYIIDNLLIEHFKKNFKGPDNYDLNRLIMQIYPQMWGCEEVSKLMNTYEIENSIKYDIVIKYRLDLFIEEPFYINKYDLNLIHGVYPYCDWIFLSNSDNMKEFLKCFYKIEHSLIPTDILENIFKMSGDNKIVYDIKHYLMLHKFENVYKNNIIT